MEPFDFEAIRARSERLEDPPARPATVAAPWWRRVLYAVPLLVVATALFLIVPKGTALLERGNRMKGEADLGFYLLRDDQVYPGDPDAVFHEGDRLQFTYRAAEDRLVLLSIDGLGHLTLYYPEAGEAGVPITPGDRHVLDSSILLDDAPGPEVFLGFFGGEWGASRARETAERVYDEGGAAALEAFADGDPSVSALLLEKE